MHTLAEFQKCFLNTLLKEETSVERSLQIYRNNFITTLTEALRSTYPCILKLVGDDFFNACAYQYLQNHPSTSGNLDQYGETFSAFLATFPPATSLPYLSEVAQLEWGYHQIFHEAENPCLDIKALTNFSEAQYANLKFRLHPATKLYSFQYPVLHIWKICQQEAEQTDQVDLSEGGIHLLVIRRHLEIEFEALTLGEYIFLNALNAGETFSDTCSKALTAENNLNVTEIFKRHVARGTIVDVSLA